MMSTKTKRSGMKKISNVKVSNIKKLKELGFTVKDIARLTGVSMVTVNDHTLPGFYEKRHKRAKDYTRRTTIVTGPKREQVVIKHLHKRDHTEVCELCGKKSRKKALLSSLG